MKLTKDFLGKMLVQEGIISQEQLEHALAYQKANQGFLGKIIVDLGYCSEENIARAMAKRAGVPFVSLEEFTIDPSAVAKLSVEAQRKYKALPIGFSGDKLLVAMQHPNNVIAIDDMRMLTGYDIKPVVVADSEFSAALEKYSRINLEFEQPADEQPIEEEVDIEAGDSSVKPAVQLANMILTQAVNAKASDVHIEVYENKLRVRFRIDGVLHDIMQLSRQMHASLVSRIKIMANMNIAERRIPQDGRMSIKIEERTIDARVASLPASFGERLTLRLLDRSAKIITLEELGIEQEVLKKFREAINMPYGCILVTGPTGSGKSTSLYAGLITVDSITKNVITVEDPVEYRMENINQIQINPKAGLTFASGLRSILRSDPDIIMIGEIRDHETAKLAIESALTGHMVFSTMHTNDAAGAISRLTEMGIEPFLIASSIICVLAQRLARVLCKNCKEEYEMTRDELGDIPDFPFDEGKNRIKLCRPVGCIRCSNTGYRGRIGVYELLFVSENIQRLALERRPAREIKEIAINEGMTTLRQDGFLKVKKGITSLEELMRVIL